jgi:ubiquinone/menaquinone biosynthesis C-methylase UbiE
LAYTTSTVSQKEEILKRAQWRDMLRVYLGVIKDLGIRKGTVVLDIGDGGFAPLVKKILVHYPNTAKNLDKIFLMDINKQKLDEAKNAIRKTNSQFLDKVLFIQGDARNMCFFDDTFKKVVASYVINECENYEKMIYEITRVAKYNAVIIISEHRLDSNNPEELKYPCLYGYHHPQNISPEELANLANKYGLELTRKVETPHAWYCVFRKTKKYSRLCKRNI